MRLIIESVIAESGTRNEEELLLTQASTYADKIYDFVNKASHLTQSDENSEKYVEMQRAIDRLQSLINELENS